MVSVSFQFIFNGREGRGRTEAVLKAALFAKLVQKNPGVFIHDCLRDNKMFISRLPHVTDQSGVIFFITSKTACSLGSLLYREFILLVLLAINYLTLNTIDCKLKIPFRFTVKKKKKKLKEAVTVSLLLCEACMFYNFQACISFIDAFCLNVLRTIIILILQSRGQYIFQLAGSHGLMDRKSDVKHKGHGFESQVRQGLSVGGVNVQHF